ncbi:hypothetical protein HID58_087914 [Brassica napus]|uniref:Uncharacterized protein n=1 Tax=Brassica napus TaxID=3708 RepID=A0ABQ7XUN1_BRANA|nr:hypothetical protein HID58_087914 [Brassica napus]
MALGRMPSVGLVPGRQLGVFSDDEPRGCAQCREGSSFHRLGDIQSGIEYSRLSLPQGSRTGSDFLRDLRGSRYLLPRSDPFRVYVEDWSPESSVMGETRYLNSLLDTPYLAGISWVPMYLTTRGDIAYRLSPFLSWGMMLLWDKPAGAWIRLSRYDASRLDIESKGLWVLTTS